MAFLTQKNNLRDQTFLRIYFLALLNLNITHMNFKSLLPALAICIIFSAFTQDKKPAVITGTIKDAHTKLPLNEAVITLSSTAFQGQKFALTDSTGTYRIGNLPAGNYTISFEMEGYEKFTQENIAVQAGSSLGVSFEMVKERRGKDKNGKPNKEKVLAIKNEEG